MASSANPTPVPPPPFFSFKKKEQADSSILLENKDYVGWDCFHFFQWLMISVKWHWFSIYGYKIKTALPPPPAFFFLNSLEL
jgi:hypothetical protein